MPSDKAGRVTRSAGSLFLLTMLLNLILAPHLVLQAQSEPPTWAVDDSGPADFRTVQEAINTAQHGDSIYVRSGVYREHVIVNKSVSLTGENRSATIIDGGGSGTIILVTVHNVTLAGFTVRNGKSGIIVTGAQNCTIKESLVEENDDRGILVTMSRNCTVSHTRASGSRYGINVNASQRVRVEENGADDNYYDGIGLLKSSDSIVRGNTVTGNNVFGIWVDGGHNNVLYHNNVFGNNVLGKPPKQASDNTQSNTWDNGFEGNYWGDYEGEDLDGDGVGDEPYIIDEETHQMDNFPLVRPRVNDVYLIIDNEPPVIAFTYSPDLPAVSETVSFDASESYDAVGRNAIADYIWDFGDGSTGTGMQVNHTYLAAGTFTVGLTVVDAAGNEGITSVDIRVDAPPLFNTALIGVVVAGATVGIAVLILWFKRKGPARERLA